MEWFILIYCLLSFIVMDEVQPQNKEHPVFNTILCFFIGGLIFIIAMAWGIVRLVRGRE